MRESRLWMLFLLAGVAMVVLLGIHMFAQHMGTLLGFLGIQTGDPLAFETVMGRASSIAWTVLYVALLAFALYHGLYGVRTIIIEIAPNAQSTVSGILLVLGLAAFIFGTYVTVTSYALGGVV